MRQGGGQQGVFDLIFFAAIAAAIYWGWTDRDQVKNFIAGVMQVLGAAATSSAVET